MVPNPDTLLTWGTGGLSVGIGLYGARLVGRGVQWLILYFTGRHDAREAHIETATRSLIEQLQRQVKDLIDHRDLVEAKLAECMDRDIEKERRIAQLEGMMAGLGDARQHAALIVANEKMKDKNGD